MIGSSFSFFTQLFRPLCTNECNTTNIFQEILSKVCTVIAILQQFTMSQHFMTGGSLPCWVNSQQQLTSLQIVCHIQHETAHKVFSWQRSDIFLSFFNKVLDCKQDKMFGGVSSTLYSTWVCLTAIVKESWLMGEMMERNQHRPIYRAFCSLGLLSKLNLQSEDHRDQRCGK